MLVCDRTFSDLYSIASSMFGNTASKLLYALTGWKLSAVASYINAK